MLNNRQIFKVMFMWGCLLIIPVCSGVADDPRDMYYSVHIDTAGDIETVARKVDRIHARGKIVFWEKREVRGLGIYYKVYLGWFEKFQSARRFMGKLKKAGWNRPMAVHWFKDPPWQKGLPAAPRATEAVRQAIAPPVPSQVPMPDRFADNGDGTVTDKKTGLMWTQNGWRLDLFAAMTWQEAIAACANFKAGGYTDWRLPTVKEWRSLVDRSVSYPAMVEPNPFKNIISHQPYWSGTEYTYVGQYTGGKAAARDSYTIMLYSGSFNHQKKTERAFVLPVRMLSKK